MQIGCLGDIPFCVSDDAVKTITNMQQSGAARYAEHKRHLLSPLLEFVGTELDTISFDIVLSAYLGVNPTREIDKIVACERSGKTLKFVLGDITYGRYRWVINKHRVKMQTFGKGGELTSATITIDLLEYAR